MLPRHNTGAWPGRTLFVVASEHQVPLNAEASDGLDVVALALKLRRSLGPRMSRSLSNLGDGLLTDAGLLRRYDPRAIHDGLPGRVGAFLACTFSLAQCQALLGRTAPARRT